MRAPPSTLRLMLFAAVSASTFCAAQAQTTAIVETPTSTPAATPAATAPAPTEAVVAPALSATTTPAAQPPAGSDAQQQAGAAITADTKPVQPTAEAPASAPAATAAAAPAPAASSDAAAVVTPASSAPIAAPPAAAAITQPAPAVQAVTAPPPPIDATAPILSAVRDLLAETPGRPTAADSADRAALAAYYKADAAALVWTTPSGLSRKARAAVALIEQSDDWGLRASDFTLPRDTAEPSASDVARQEVTLGLAVLKYVRFARGGRMDPTDLSFSIDRKPEHIQPAVALADLARVDDAAIYLRSQHPRHPQFERLRQAYLAIRDGRQEPVTEQVEAKDEPVGKKGRKAAKAPARKELSREAKLATLVRNMEMWRWMPRNLGRFHVFANIPEYKFRVVRNDTVVHEERVIVGKVANQTPAFSDTMEFLVFQPFWGVPDSIKVKDVLPGLLRGGGGIVAKNGLRVQRGGRDIDPRTIDWRRTDIRNFHVYQPPGRGNVLGQVKFMFPNAHQVYMHDTPTKHLFSSNQRTYSHGCVRVRDPLKFAEVLMAEDRGWTMSDVKRTVDQGPENNNVKLNTRIPVHLAYFTAQVDDAGKLSFLNDVYGHEKLVQMGLDGKAHLIVKKKEDLGPIRAEVVSSLAETEQGFNWWGSGASSSGGGSVWGGGNGWSGGTGTSSGSGRSWVRDAFSSN